MRSFLAKSVDQPAGTNVFLARYILWFSASTWRTMGLGPFAQRSPFLRSLDMKLFRDHLRSFGEGNRDKKWWSLTANGSFSVKSFYNFLNDGGIRCPISIGWYGRIRSSCWKILKSKDATSFRRQLVWCAMEGLSLSIISSFTTRLLKMFGSICLGYFIYWIHCSPWVKSAIHREPL